MSLRVAKQKPANVLSVAIVTRDPARREELAQVVAHAGHAIVDTSSADVVLVDGSTTSQQIEAACTMGNWPVSLRQCFASGTTLAALQGCIHDVK